jgi:hypothetical protein
LTLGNVPPAEGVPNGLPVGTDDDDEDPPPKVVAAGAAAAAAADAAAGLPPPAEGSADPEAPGTGPGLKGLLDGCEAISTIKRYKQESNSPEYEGKRSSIRDDPGDRKLLKSLHTCSKVQIKFLLRQHNCCQLEDKNNV